MSERTLTEKIKSVLLETLEETFERHHGIFIDKGTSLFETLENLSAKEASLSIVENGATVAAHVEHAGFYLDVLERSMRNEAIEKIDWREIWERVRAVSPDEWMATKRRLRESHRRTIETIKTCDDFSDNDVFGAALGVLAHTAYHLGALRQMATIIKSAGTNKLNDSGMKKQR